MVGKLHIYVSLQEGKQPTCGFHQWKWHFQWDDPYVKLDNVQLLKWIRMNMDLPKME
jgi:hypothetical protein